MEAYQLTATQVLASFKDGSLTVEDYACSLLSRIEQRDAAVKAWAYLDPEYVMKQARLLDQTPMEQRGPLHGIAVAVKDVIYTEGSKPLRLSRAVVPASANQSVPGQTCPHSSTRPSTKAMRPRSTQHPLPYFAKPAPCFWVQPAPFLFLPGHGADRTPPRQARPRQPSSRPRRWGPRPVTPTIPPGRPAAPPRGLAQPSAISRPPWV